MLRRGLAVRPQLATCSSGCTAATPMSHVVQVYVDCPFPIVVQITRRAPESTRRRPPCMQPARKELILTAVQARWPPLIYVKPVLGVTRAFPRLCRSCEGTVRWGVLGAPRLRHPSTVVPIAVGATCDLLSLQCSLSRACTCAALLQSPPGKF